MYDLLKVAVLSAALLTAGRGAIETTSEVQYSFLKGGRVGSTLSFKRAFRWAADMKEDIELKWNGTLRDAYEGAVVDMTIERRLVDEQCSLAACSHCAESKGQVEKEVHQQHLIYNVSYPCPVCLGMGVVTSHSCNPYRYVQEEVQVNLPAGIRPGFSTTLNSLGNDSIGKGGRRTLGNLVVTVHKLKSEDEDIELTSTGLQYTMKLLPSKALRGFDTTITLFDKYSVGINRTDTVTLPDEIMYVENYGFPNGTGYGDLKVIFKLKSRYEIYRSLKDKSNCDADSSMIAASSPVFDIPADATVEVDGESDTSGVISEILFFESSSGDSSGSSTDEPDHMSPAGGSCTDQLRQERRKEQIYRDMLLLLKDLEADNAGTKESNSK